MKLANNMTKMTDSVMFKEGTNIASESRKNIFEGKVTPGLAPATIERRAEGTSDYPGHTPHKETWGNKTFILHWRAT